MHVDMCFHFPAGPKMLSPPCIGASTPSCMGKILMYHRCFCMTVQPCDTETAAAVWFIAYKHCNIRQLRNVTAEHTGLTTAQKTGALKQSCQTTLVQNDRLTCLQFWSSIAQSQRRKNTDMMPSRHVKRLKFQASFPCGTAVKEVAVGQGSSRAPVLVIGCLHSCIVLPTAVVFTS